MYSHGCHVLRSIMKSEEGRCNFLVHKPRGEQQRFRALLMEMVLATDMKQHFALISRFKTLITNSPLAAGSELTDSESLS